MSSSDPRLPRRLILAACLVAAALSGCTVRPLYSDAVGPTSAITPEVAGLRAISIPPVSTRVAQQVRNDLIFLFNGGANQPAQPLYNMQLNVVSGLTEGVLVSAQNEKRNTAGSVTVTGSYVLTRVGTGEQVAAGTRQISAAYDRANQEFAVMRARIDAEDRAARELAELLRLEIGQKLSRLPATPAS